MEHSGTYPWGVSLGIGAALILLLIVKFVLFKYNGRTEYDERQKLAQGKAYKYAFSTLLIYLIGYGWFDLCTGIRWCDLYTGCFIGAILSVTVFTFICIRMDAYMSFKQPPRRTLVLLGVIAAVNLLPTITHVGEQGFLISDGRLTWNVLNLMLGVLFVVLEIALLLRLRQEKRQEKV